MNDDEETFEDMLAATRVKKTRKGSPEKIRRSRYWNYHRDPAANIAKNAAWQRANKERVNAKQRAYRARKKAATAPPAIAPSLPAS